MKPLGRSRKMQIYEERSYLSQHVLVNLIHGTRCLTKSNLKEEELTLAHSVRRLFIIGCEEPWDQVGKAKWKDQHASWSHDIWSQRAEKWTKQHPTQHCQQGTKYPNTWAFGKYFTLKPHFVPVSYRLLAILQWKLNSVQLQTFLWTLFWTVPNNTV